MEILSPGGPFGQVTTANFGEPMVVDYRNPTVAGVLGQLGYVQRFGAGIDVARRAMGANGNPAPGFLVNPTAVNVRLELLR